MCICTSGYGGNKKIASLRGTWQNCMEFDIFGIMIFINEFLELWCSSFSKKNWIEDKNVRKTSQLILHIYHCENNRCKCNKKQLN